MGPPGNRGSRGPCVLAQTQKSLSSPRAIGDYGAPVSLPKLKKAYEKGTRGISWGPLLTSGPQAIGDHGAPVSFPKLKKAYEKDTRGISWGPLLTPGPLGSARVSNGQSAP
ncbi:unnamed protein product, partial [Staurois parvus]